MHWEPVWRQRTEPVWRQGRRTLYDGSRRQIHARSPDPQNDRSNGFNAALLIEASVRTTEVERYLPPSISRPQGLSGAFVSPLSGFNDCVPPPGHTDKMADPPERNSAGCQRPRLEPGSSSVRNPGAMVDGRSSPLAPLIGSPPCSRDQAQTRPAK